MTRFPRLVAATLGVILLSIATVRSQPYTGQLAMALSQLTNGIISYAILGMNTSAYINFGSGRGTSGYGIRDNAGVLQFKGLNGSWVNLPTTAQAPDNATYLTQTPNAVLTSEQAFSTLASALLRNTTGTGVVSAYAGTTCGGGTFVRALSALAVATCDPVSLATDVTGTLSVPLGGTGLTTVAQGDLLYGSGVNTLALLAKDASATRYLANTGAGNNPAWAQVSLITGVTGTLPLTSGGTGQITALAAFNGLSPLTTQGDLLYHDGTDNVRLAKTGVATRYLSNTGAANDPAWAAINLANGVTGTLPVTNGGTGLITYTIGDLIYASAATTLTSLLDVATGNAVISGGVGVAPVWGKIGLTTHVVGTLPVTNGGTNLTGGTSGGVLYYSGAATLASSALLTQYQLVIGGGVGAAPYTLGSLGTAGQLLLSTGAGMDPAWSNLTDKLWYPAGWCDNGAPATVKVWPHFSMDSVNRPTPVCDLGTNVFHAYLTYLDTEIEQAQESLRLPATWTGTVDAAIVWQTAAIAGDVVWQIATACVATGESGDPAWNAASTVTQTAQGVANRYNTATITSVTITGCAAGELMYWRILRDPAAGGDTLGDTAYLVGVELTTRRTT